MFTVYLSGEIDVTPDQHICFVCPQCSKQLRAPVLTAGRSAKCNSCGAAVRIPSLPPTGQFSFGLEAAVAEAEQLAHQQAIAKQLGGCLIFLHLRFCVGTIVDKTCLSAMGVE
ncbi:MAG: hypothetical protein KDB03_02385 [Planctomycetales bacterium]|nr:hypothetical protein [Planctomycetales bacterium]